MRAATRDVCLRLDLRSAPEDALPRLLPLLSALRCHSLLLAPRHAGGEALLRAAPVRAASGASLRCLAASLACTDTLARFPALEELHLHAGVLDTLYPGRPWRWLARSRMRLGARLPPSLAQLPLASLDLSPNLPPASADPLAAAVLGGLPALRRLGLHGYRDADLSRLPPGVAASLRVRSPLPGRHGALPALNLLRWAAVRLAERPWPAPSHLRSWR